MSTPIPAFYRVLFTSIDPLMCLGGALGSLLAPASILESYTQSFVSPIAAETTVLLDATAGWFAGMAFLQAVLLRARPTDLVVWRAIQVAMVCVDIAMLAALARALVAEGRTETGMWRGGDWGNVVGYPVLILARGAFLAGVGFGKAKSE